MSSSFDRAFRSVIVSAAVLCAGEAYAQDVPKYLTPEFGNAYTLAAQPDGTLSVRVPVRSEPKINVAELGVSIMDVAVESRHDPALHGCFKATLDTIGSGMPALTVVVACASRRPDVYELTLGVRLRPAAPAKPAGQPTNTRSTGERTKTASLVASAVQKVALKLMRPAAAVRTIASQSVDRVILVPGISTPTLTPQSLTISETSGRTLPIEFSAKQVDPSTIDARPVPGTLAFTSAKTGKDGHAALTLHVAEEFPLGKAKTTVEVRASDLATPIYVPYEITTRLHSWLVLPAIIVGLLLGYLTRTVLRTIIERGTARIAALDLLEKMRSELNRWEDAAFATSVTPLVTTLEAQARTADAATLKTALTTADAAFAIAQNEVRQRASEILRSIETTAALTTEASRFPKAITVSLTRAEQALASARLLVAEGKIDKGKQGFDVLTGNLRRDVDAAAATWRAQIQNALITLNAVVLPPTIDARLKVGSATMTEQTANLPVGSATPDVAAILNAVHPIRFLAQHDVIERVLVPLSETAGRVADILRRAGASVARTDAARGVLGQTIAADVDTSLEEPATAAARLVEAMREDITTAAAASTTDVTEELSGGRYIEAARQAVGGQGRLLGRQAEAQDALQTIPAHTTVVPSFTISPLFAPTISLTAHEPIQVVRARTLREIVTAKAAQFSVAAVGVAVVGLLMLLPTFDGTWRGILTALFWGYAGDISVDALTETAKRLK